MNLLGARPHYGTVMAIDRDARRLRWRPLGSTDDEIASYDGRESHAPWPLARAQFDVSGRLPHCKRPIGRREVLFRDHFTRVNSASGYGDKPWTLAGGGSAAQVSNALGAVRVAFAASTTTLSTDTDALTPNLTTTIGMTARFAVSGSWADLSGSIAVGLRGAAMIANGDVTGTETGSWVLLYTNVLGADARVFDGSTVVADEYIWADIMVSGTPDLAFPDHDATVAGWVNGNGPSIAHPVFLDQVEAQVFVGIGYADVDCVTVYTVSEPLLARLHQV